MGAAIRLVQMFAYDKAVVPSDYFFRIWINVENVIKFEWYGKIINEMDPELSIFTHTWPASCLRFPYYCHFILVTDVTFLYI